jgi:hypothetical protein
MITFSLVLVCETNYNMSWWVVLEQGATDSVWRKPRWMTIQEIGTLAADDLWKFSEELNNILRLE